MRSRSGSASAGMLVALAAAMGLLGDDYHPFDDFALVAEDGGYTVTHADSTVTFQESGFSGEPNVTVCTPDGCTTAFTQTDTSGTATVTCAVSGDGRTTLDLLEQATGRSYTIEGAAASQWSRFAYQNHGASKDGTLDLSPVESRFDVSVFLSNRHFDVLAVCEDMYDDMYAVTALGMTGGRVYGFKFEVSGGTGDADM